jgi:hypothetical protein
VQFVRNVIEFVKYTSTFPSQSPSITAIENDLWAIFNNKQNTRRKLFHHRFQDILYVFIMTHGDSEDLPKRYNSSISSYILPFLKQMATQLKHILYFNMEVHAGIYKECLLKLSVTNNKEAKEMMSLANAASLKIKAKSAVHSAN